VTDLGLAPRHIIGGDLLLPDAFVHEIYDELAAA
jgi:hypothetical protein